MICAGLMYWWPGWWRDWQLCISWCVDGIYLTEVFVPFEEGSGVMLGMRIFPATLETMVGCGHSWEAVNFLTLGASVHGSKAYMESGGVSPGNSTSRNSPGKMVVEVGRKCSTMA